MSTPQETRSAEGLRLSAIASQCHSLDRAISNYLAVPHFEVNEIYRESLRRQFSERLDTLLASLQEVKNGNG